MDQRNDVMSSHRPLILSLFAFAIFGCSSNEDLPTVPELNLDQYAGTWYEVWRLPNSFEKGLECVTATYTLLPNGKVEVLNQGVKGSKRKSITGKAWVPDPGQPARLKVRFFWPFTGDYYVIELADDYSYALVGDPSRKFLWILARDPELPGQVVDDLKSIAMRLGFDTSAMIEIDHNCD